MTWLSTMFKWERKQLFGNCVTGFQHNDHLRSTVFLYYVCKSSVGPRQKKNFRLYIYLQRFGSPTNENQDTSLNKIPYIKFRTAFAISIISSKNYVLLSMSNFYWCFLYLLNRIRGKWVFTILWVMVNLQIVTHFRLRFFLILKRTAFICAILATGVTFCQLSIWLTLPVTPKWLTIQFNVVKLSKKVSPVSVQDNRKYYLILSPSRLWDKRRIFFNHNLLKGVAR